LAECRIDGDADRVDERRRGDEPEDLRKEAEYIGWREGWAIVEGERTQHRCEAADTDFVGDVRWGRRSADHLPQASKERVQLSGVDRSCGTLPNERFDWKTSEVAECIGSPQNLVASWESRCDGGTRGLSPDVEKCAHAIVSESVNNFIFIAKSKDSSIVTPSGEQYRVVA
jgi:hypothetical protein